MSTRQAIPVLKDREANETARVVNADPAEVSALIALFDAAETLAAVRQEAGERFTPMHLTVYAERAPSAMYAARLWASARNFKLEVLSGTSDIRPGVHIESINVMRGIHVLFTVYAEEIIGDATGRPVAEVAAVAGDVEEYDAGCSCGWKGPADRADEHPCRFEAQP